MLDTQIVSKTFTGDIIMIYTTKEGLNMSTEKNKFPKLQPLAPVKFPSRTGGGKVVYKIRGTAGRPTREVIAEMKKLSRNDIFATQQ